MPYNKEIAKIELEKIDLKIIRGNMENQFLQNFSRILFAKKI